MKKPWDFDDPLCRESGGAYGGDLWFLDTGVGKSVEQIKMIKKICGACSDKFDCLEYALQYKVLGIWGGTTFAERENIRKQRNITAIDVLLPFNAGKYKETA